MATGNINNMNFSSLYISSLIQINKLMHVCLFIYQQMHSKFHVLSPLVAAREFRFIKFHVEMDDNAWLVGNFSYDCSQVRPPTPPRTAPCWMLPSGCLIQDVGDGMSKVSSNNLSFFFFCVCVCIYIHI